MAKFSRDKGKRYEQQLARAYRAEGYDVSRNSNQAHQDATGIDVKGDILGLAGLHIQAKCVEKLNIWDAREQARAEAPDGWIPSVHFRRNHTDTWVAIPLEHWFRLLRQARR